MIHNGEGHVIKSSRTVAMSRLRLHNSVC